MTCHSRISVMVKPFFKDRTGDEDEEDDGDRYPGVGDGISHPRSSLRVESRQMK